MVRVLPETVQKLIHYTDSAFQRCQKLTLGFNTPGLVEALNDFFCGIAGRFQKLLLQIRSETGIYALESSHPEDGVYSGPQSQKGTLPTQTPGGGPEDEDYEIKRDEFGRQEWNHFQMGLRLLSSVLIILEKVEREWDKSVDHLLKSVEPFVLLASTSSGAATAAEISSGEEASAKTRERTFCESSLLSLRLSSLNSVHLSQWISRAHSAPSSHKYFERAVKQLESLLQKCQKYLFDTMILPIDKRLSALPSLPVWALKSAPNPSPFQLEMPQFSLSPSEYVTRMGEHLLSLPQQLDLYVDDPGLGVGLEGLPHLEPLLGTSLFGYKGSYLSKESEEEQGEENSDRQDGGEKDNQELDTEEEELDITYIWMTSVCRGTMSLFCDKVLTLKVLTDHGRSQLLTDMQYVVNVLSAMDIEPTEEYSVLMMVLEKDLAALKEAVLEEEEEEKRDEWAKKHGALAKKVLSMRGGSE